jgi:hypothetical protein
MGHRRANKLRFSARRRPSTATRLRLQSRGMQPQRASRKARDGEDGAALIPDLPFIAAVVDQEFFVDYYSFVSS